MKIWVLVLGKWVRAANSQLPPRMGINVLRPPLPPPSRLHQPLAMPGTSRYRAPPLLVSVTLKILTIWVPPEGGGSQDPTLYCLLAQASLGGTPPDSSSSGPPPSPSPGRLVRVLICGDGERNLLIIISRGGSKREKLRGAESP